MFFNCVIWNKTTTTTAVVMFCERRWKFQVLVSQFTWAFILILLVGSHVHEQTTLQSQLFLVFVSVCKYELSYLSVFLLELFRGHFFFCLQTANSDKLTSFINTLNGKDGNLCHLVTVPPGPLLSDALISSPLLQGEDGAPAGMEYASEYGFDPNSDPELALVSD